jgi:succinate dehydrogenase / fumarate reductase iron-sulfur subunit
MNLTLKIWRQKSKQAAGSLVDYKVSNINEHMSFLEMLDVLNEDLLRKGEDPVTFDHDCREGICGTCSLFINGRPHGPNRITTCQLHMRNYKDGDTIIIEPWRSEAFPIVKDLMVDRSAFDRVMQAGGFVSANTGSARDANEILIGKEVADEAMSSASCIGCGACVAACKNSSAMLFVGAKVSQLAMLPQGKPEAKRRAEAMVAQMDAEGFGACTNTMACVAECRKSISMANIIQLNREFISAKLTSNNV